MRNHKTSSVLVEDHPSVIQDPDTVRSRFIALEEKVRAESVTQLNHILADTITLRDLYKKHHWQASGPDFYQLHLLFDKHYEEQATLADAIAERVQTLGGVSIAMAGDVIEETCIERPPRGREKTATQLFRLAQAHELVIADARRAARRAADLADDGTNDLLVSSVLRTNEQQAWFLAEQMTRDSNPNPGKTL